MSSELSGSRLRLYALCGVIAPVFFTVMVIVEGFLVPGYSHMTQQMSDLGAYSLYGSYALLQNFNFFVSGILMIMFAFGLRRGLPGSRAIATSLGLFGFMFFLLGFFPDEPIPWPAAAHYLIAWVGGASLLFSQFFAWRRFRRSVAGEGSSWIMYGRFSLVCLVFFVVSFVVLAAFGQPGSPIRGLVQRISEIPVLGWIEVMALGLLRLSKT